MDSKIYTLIYTSDAAHELSDRELQALMEESRSNNCATEVTGALIYKDAQFIQVLEGDRDAVEAVFERIARDARHQNVRVVHRGHHDRRAYADWTMALHRPEDAGFARMMGFVSQLEPVESDPGASLRSML